MPGASNGVGGLIRLSKILLLFRVIRLLQEI